MTGTPKKLNAAQKEAVQKLDGPVLITAGPGTGKTHLLSFRAAAIMKERKVPGENILILTYTNAAARSVKERLAGIVGFAGYRIFADTFHGFANSVILDSEEAAGTLGERIQMTDLEKIQCLQYIIDTFTGAVKELRPFGYPYLYMREIARRISELKNEGVEPAEFERYSKGIAPDGVYVDKKHVPRLSELAFIYRKYEELKKGKDPNIFDERGRYDYDDMIMLAIKTLDSEPSLMKAYRERFRYVMVDEFQDTNGAQLELLFRLCGEKKPNLLCVGDDDQSIYRFQGASVSNFRALKERFPGIKAISLKENYRSTKEIIGLFSGIIGRIPAGERMDPEKKLLPRVNYGKKNIEFVRFSAEDEEVEFILKKIKSIKKDIENSGELAKDEKKRPYNNIAVLVRKRAFMLKLIDGFLKAGIPYATDGKEDISREKRVRQMLDALRLAAFERHAENERDLALYRILTSDFFRIPQERVLRFVNDANRTVRSKNSNLFSEFISAYGTKNPDKRPAPKDPMFFAARAIQRLVRDADSRPVHDILLGFIEDSGLYRFLITGYDKNRILLTRELRALTSFVNMVKNMALSRPDLTLSGFIGELDTMKSHGMAVAGDLVTSTQDGVRVLTAHSSKGLEFHTCLIPFCIQDKSWPLKPRADLIPLPPGIMKRKDKLRERSDLERLNLFDETRLFYVAASRARSNIIFTASPRGDSVSSSFFNNLPIEPKKTAAKEEDTLAGFLKKRKTGGFEKETRAALKDLVKNLVLTPTKLNSFLRCGRKFLYANLLLLPGRKNQSLVFGNCAHKALEDVYNKYKIDGNFPDFGFFRASFGKELRFQGVNKSVESWCLAKLDSLEGWFRQTSVEPVMPIDLEKKKIVSLKGGVAFSGKYDKVEFEDKKRGLIRIIDYKTGKPDEHVKKLDPEADLMSENCDDYFRQLVAYKMLYERDTREPSEYRVSHGVLVFLEPAKRSHRRYNLKKGDYVEKKLKITDEKVDELEKGILEVWRRINNLEFDKLPEPDPKKCKNCVFYSTCWE